MRNRTRLIQSEYSTDFESESGHLIVVEDISVASYVVRVLTPKTRLPLLSRIQH